MFLKRRFFRFRRRYFQPLDRPRHPLFPPSFGLPEELTRNSWRRIIVFYWYVVIYSQTPCDQVRAPWPALIYSRVQICV
jgi:hypothetical protein